MPYDILEPEPKGYEVLEPEAEPKPVKAVEDAIPDWMKGGNTPMTATIGGAAAVPVSSLADTLKSKAFQEALNTSPLQRVGLTPDLVIPGTAAPKPLQPITVPIAAGAKMALGLANAFTTPKGLMELGALFTPAAPLVAGKWIYDMVKGAGESAGDLTEKITRLIKDPQSFTAQDVQAVGDDVVNFIGQAAGAGGLGAHQITRIKARIDPRTDFGKKLSEELDKTTPEETKTVAAAAQTLPAAAAEAEKGVTENASQERNVQESVLGERAGDDAQRPPAETSGGGGVRPTEGVSEETVPRTEAGQVGLLLTEKEKEIQARIPKLTDESLRITVSRDPELPAADYVQVDEVPGDKFSSNPETLRKLGYDMPSSAELLKLPRGQYTLSQAREMLKKAEPPPPVTGEAPRQPVPTGAFQSAPQEGVIAGQTTGSPPGTTKGDISTAKEQVPVLGPGAKTVGEPPYSAAQLLTDQLKATPPTGTKENLSLREKIADKWAQGKTLFERAFGTGRAISESLKETARGVRDITDLDRRVGELDYLLQRSSGLSKNMKKAILQQQPNKATREAVALWIDAGGDVGRLRDTLAKLPTKTAPSVRRALERAINLPPEAIQFAEGLKQFYGIRLNDAQQAGVFEKFLDDYYTHVWQKPSNMPEDLRAHYSTGRVSDYFQFARQRSIPTFLDGILQGMKPILDPAEVLPGYNYALDRAIASRKFVKELSEINAPDGRPAVLPTGTAQRVEGDTGGMFINPKGKGELGKDYHVIDHPAMRKWKWMGTDENGNPVMYRSDLAANPGVHERLARMLDQRLATPSKWGKRLLRASTEVKGLKLGLLSAFHQVHVGSHANWHWTNPFKGGEIDWDAPETRFAIEKGHLKLAGDAADIANFAEGLISPGLVHKIPIVGPWSKAYSEWVFTVLIPRLKLNTFKNAYPRNLKHYAKDIQSGRITEEQIAARVGDSVNNAYGELNHWFLGKYGRSPQFQRILRGVFLAPDFGEARLRFAAKALTRYGMEERLAFATMIGTMYLAARVGNWLSHGDPELDIKNAFRVKVGKEWVSMRSVAGDLLHAITNFGQFMYVRLNPLYSRTISDVLFQRDVYGRKLSMGDILLKRPAQQLVPINLTGLTREDQKLWESAITSMGLQVQHDVPAMDIGKLKRQWLLKNPDPKLRAMGERSEQELFPPSDYSKLRRALIDNDMKKAKAEYESLQKDKGKKHTDIVKALSPISGGRIVNGRYVDTKIKPIGGEIGYGNEQKFRASLTPAERKLYLQALAERKLIFDRFRSMLAGAK